MTNFALVLLIVFATVCLFLVMKKIYEKKPHPLLFPVLTTTTLVSVFLLLFHIPYDTYMQGGVWLQQLLGPAVVALAVPLYNQRYTIYKYKYAILSSVSVAMLSGLVSVIVLLKLFGASESFLLTSLPKSLTTPVAMQVSETVGGIAPLTAVLVMVAGFTGAILGPTLFRVFKIHTAISRGVAMGSVSHGVGISKLKEYDEETLSIGSLSMGLSAILGAFISPLFAIWFI